MGRRYVQLLAKKVMCLVMSVTLITGSFAGSVLAVETEADQVTSPLMLTTETGAFALADNGRSVEVKLCLTQADSLIQQKVFTEDVVLGGVFRNMVVHNVSNDHTTILLDLIGVPDFSDESGEGQFQGTMEFPGFLFDSEDSVTASIDITRREGLTEGQIPSFRPYLDGLRTDSDKVEMIMVLLPLLGRFASDFGADDVAFTDGLRGAKVRIAREAEDGCFELIVEAPKAAMEGENGDSCFGGIVLRDGSMITPDGRIYGKTVSAYREFFMDSAGRDLSDNDINSIKNIVGGFGNTTAGTITSVLSGAGTAFSVGSTVLGLVGVLPTDASRHKELMKKLQEIQNKLNKVSEQCDYMVGALDHHTKMLINMTRDSNEKYVGDFDSQLSTMAGIIDSLERDMQKPLIQKEIEEALLRVCERYEIPQTGIGRDIDDDFSIVPDDEYLEYDFEAAEDSYAEDMMAFDALLATGTLFEDNDEAVEVPDAIGTDGEGVKLEWARTDHPEAGAEEGNETGAGTEAAAALSEDETTAQETQAAENETTAQVTQSAAGKQSEAATEKPAETQPEETKTTEETGMDETGAKGASDSETESEMEDETGAVQGQDATDVTTAPETQAAAEETTAPETQAAEEEITAPETQAAAEETTAPETQAAAEETTAPETQAAAEETTAPETQAAAEETTAPETQAAAEETTAPETQAADEKQSETAAETTAETQPTETKTTEEANVDETGTEESSEVETEAVSVSESESESESESAAADETQPEETKTTEEAGVDETEIDTETGTEGSSEVETEAATETVSETETETETGTVQGQAAEDETTAEETEAAVEAQAQEETAEEETQEDAADEQIETEVFSETEEDLEDETEEETEPETETEEEEGRLLSELEKEQFLRDLNYEVAQVRLTGTETIGDRVRKVLNYYQELYPLFNKDDSSNPIVSFCDIHKATDNFATSSLDVKETYKQNIKYQFARALNILVALDSATSHQDELEAFNKRNAVDDGTVTLDPVEDKGFITWVKVDQIGPAPTDAKGNPYCYLMEDYVRLATTKEASDLLYALHRHDSSKNVISITSKSGQNVYMSDFIERMQGRTLQEELELAGIQNLDAVRKETYVYETNNIQELKEQYKNPVGGSFYNPKDVKTEEHEAAFAGITFRFERWGHAGEAYKTMTESPPLATYREDLPLHPFVNCMEAKKYSFHKEKDFMYVCPEFLRWPDNRANLISTELGSIDIPGNVEVPDGSYHRQYSYSDQLWYYGMPMTYFVRLSR